ncbi:LytR/AlgR family response regulator transcription factor [Ferruginibacter sp.]|nr:LytTR family transcriptional regulator [Ferruginibacter sp.]
MNNNILLLPHSTGIAVIDINSIIRVEAISNYSKLFFTNGKTLVVAKVLKWFETVLAGKGFTRIHRSHLINMQWVESCSYLPQLKIVLHNQEQLSVSRRKKGEVIKTLLITTAA